MGLVLTEEAEDIVWIVATHEASHEVVLAWNGQSVRTAGFTDALIEVVVQLLGDNLVGIHYQHPFVLGLVDGIFTGRLHNVIRLALEGDDSAAIALGDSPRLVCRLHVAYHDLVEVLHRLQHPFQMLLGIVGVDYYRYFFIHACKIKHNPSKYQTSSVLFRNYFWFLSVIQ